MTTLMSWSKNGKTVGRCDASCHKATTSADKCKCSCQGAFHGAALGHRPIAAREDYRLQVIRTARHWANAHGYDLHVPDRQLQLFPPHEDPPDGPPKIQ